MRITKTEPVLTAGVIAGAIVAVLAIFGVILDTSTVETVIVSVLPFLLSIFARGKVSPISSDS